MSFETKKNIITDKIVSLDTKLKFDDKELSEKRSYFEIIYKFNFFL